LSRAKELGFTTVLAPRRQSGQLGSSHAASAGLKAMYSFRPTWSRVKFSTRSFMVRMLSASKGIMTRSIDCAQKSRKIGWAFVNVNMRPITRKVRRAWAMNNRAIGLESAKAHGGVHGFRITLNQIQKSYQEFIKLGLVPRQSSRSTAHRHWLLADLHRAKSRPGLF